MKATNYSELAAIAIDKSLLKEYETSNGRTVYLDKNSEFQIKLFNPYTYNIEAEICIDGKSLGDRLVIRPGQLVWLERYFDVARKFKFDVYEVDGSDEAVQKAISQNGNIEIKFYKEKEKPDIYWNNVYVYELSDTTFCDNVLHPLDNTALNAYYSVSTPADNIDSLTTSSIDTSVSSYNEKPASNFKSLKRNISANIETGRVEKGGYSDQKFKTIDMDFEYWPFATERIKLLPKSMKQVYKEDLQKIYCTECGRKVKPKFKFCPFCGNKL